MRAALRALPLAACLALVAVGLGLVVADHFRRGCVLVGAGMLLAAGLRAVLPDHAAGLLRVRARWIDVLVTVVFGLALVVVALVVPSGG